MKCRIALVLAVLAALPLAAAADILITVDGLQIETEGAWKVKGRIVMFTARGEKALTSLRLTEIDLEASEKATAEAKAKSEAEAEAKAKKPPPPAVSPLTRAILEGSAKEDVESVLQIGHDDVSGQEWQDVRQAVGEAMRELGRLHQRYNLLNPEGLRQARYKLRLVVNRLRAALRKPTPKRQEITEGRRAVKELADLLDQVIDLASSNPHLAIRLLHQAGLR